MEEDIKTLNYRGLAHLVERIKAFFIKNPKNRATGRYLRCIDSDGNVEWADFPSYVNLIDGFDPTSLIIGGTAGRTLTTEAEVKGDCYIATAAGTLFPGTVSAMTLEAGDSIIFRKDVAAGTTVTANDIIFIESSVSISPGTSLLSWDTEITLATVEGVPIKAKLPANPNTDTQADWNETDTNSAAYINNKPTVPAAQVNADWNASSGVSEILNKPSLATVATSGSYADLINRPTFPTVNDATYSVKTDVSGTETVVSDFTANQSSADDITFVQGTNVILTPDTTNKKITIAATDTTYSDFSGSTHGLVPGAQSGDSGKFLKADGSWDVPANINTTYKFTIGSTTYGDVNGTSLGSLASETAAASGTILSLVTTGEKDTWNNKQPAGNYKTTQTAVSDPTASSTTSTTFIDSISLDTNGVITVTKKTLPAYPTVDGSTVTSLQGNGVSITAGVVTIKGDYTTFLGPACMKPTSGSNPYGNEWDRSYRISVDGDHGCFIYPKDQFNNMVICEGAANISDTEQYELLRVLAFPSDIYNAGDHVKITVPNDYTNHNVGLVLRDANSDFWFINELIKHKYIEVTLSSRTFNIPIETGKYKQVRAIDTFTSGITHFTWNSSNTSWESDAYAHNAVPTNKPITVVGS